MHTEQVVLVDPQGRVVGERAKAEVHHSATPLHLAFSLHIFDHDGRVLLTRRALTKQTWPGVWTNSCCGHPGVGEPMEGAIRRRVSQELGLQIGAVRCLLPDFAYAAQDASGIWENEICPVFAAETVHPNPILEANPVEVMDFAWTQWQSMATAMAVAPFAFSPWAVQQVGLLGGQQRP